MNWLNRINTASRRCWLIGALSFLSACGSVPNNRYWDLYDASPSASKKSSTAIDPLSCSLMLEPIIVPSIFQRAEIVVNGPKQQRVFAGHEFWAAPFPQVLGTALAQQFEQLTAIPMQRNETANFYPAANLILRLELREIQNQLTVNGASVSWQAIWQWRTPARNPSPAQTWTFAIHEYQNGEPYPALVAATTTATQRLAEQLQQSLVANKFLACQR